MSLLNIQDGRTAIFYAAERGYINIVQLLIDHGIDLKLKDKVHTYVSRIMALYVWEHIGDIT